MQCCCAHAHSIQSNERAMLQATRLSGEQSAVRLSQLYPARRQISSLSSITGQARHAFIAPALLRASSRSRNITASRYTTTQSFTYGRSTAIQLHQLRFQSTQSQADASKAVKVDPFPGDLAQKKPSNAAISTTSSGSSSSTTQEKQAAAAASKTEVTNEKPSASTSTTLEKPKSKEASSSSSVAKPKDPLLTRVWIKVKHEASHYWSGTKLLGKEIRISARLQMKLLRGKSLTRREKRQVRACIILQEACFSLG
jgi:hypothetical protein